MTTRRLILLLVVGRIHLSAAATDLIKCIKELAQPDSLDDEVCNDFSSLFGPSNSCLDKKFAYKFNYGIDVQGKEKDTVEALFPHSNGKIVEIDDTTTGGYPYVVVKHDLTRTDCVFDGEPVNSIYIKYLHVDSSGKNGKPLYSVGSTFLGDKGKKKFTLGSLVPHQSFCGDDISEPIDHISLGIELSVGYTNTQKKSHHISPTFLFGMDNANKLSFSHTNLYHQQWDETLDTPFFDFGENIAINITGTKCQANYNKFHIRCEDTTSGENVEGKWDHYIELNERENTHLRYDEEIFAASPHFKPQSFDGSNSKWSMALHIPADVQDEWWDGAHWSCDIQCRLSVYDIEGNSMGSFSFKGQSPSCSEETSDEDNDAPITTVPPIATATTTTTTNAPSTWFQMAPDMIGGQYFMLGYSVAFNGTRVAAGAPNASLNGLEYNGALQTFDLGANGNNQVGDNISGQSQFDRTGSAVAMSEDGTRVAVSASNPGSTDGEEEVIVYKFGSGWEQVGQTITNVNADEETGDSIALSHNGRILAVGSPRANMLRGKVQVYEFDGLTEWQTKGQSIDGIDSFDQLGAGPYMADATGGHSVALSGDGTVLAVGAHSSDGVDNNERSKGHVWVFRFSNNAWEMTGEILGEDTGDHSGTAVALSTDGMTLAIGSPEHNDPLGNIDDDEYDHGQVRVFQYSDANGWEEVFKVLGNSQERCGNALTLSGSGSRLAISCPGVNSWAGAVRVYDFNGNDWELLGNELVGDNAWDHFGTALDFSLNGERLAVGAQIGNYVRTFEYGSPQASQS